MSACGTKRSCVARGHDRHAGADAEPVARPTGRRSEARCRRGRRGGAVLGDDASTARPSGRGDDVAPPRRSVPEAPAQPERARERVALRRGPRRRTARFRRCDRSPSPWPAARTSKGACAAPRPGRRRPAPRTTPGPRATAGGWPASGPWASCSSTRPTRAAAPWPSRRWKAGRAGTRRRRGRRNQWQPGSRGGRKGRAAAPAVPAGAGCRARRWYRRGAEAVTGRAQGRSRCNSGAAGDGWQGRAHASGRARPDG